MCQKGYLILNQKMTLRSKALLCVLSLELKHEFQNVSHSYTIHWCYKHAVYVYYDNIPLSLSVNASQLFIVLTQIIIR